MMSQDGVIEDAAQGRQHRGLGAVAHRAGLAVLPGEPGEPPDHLRPVDVADAAPK
jgi:hypothetical protein